jgi:hypothetical protein
MLTDGELVMDFARMKSDDKKKKKEKPAKEESEVLDYFLFKQYSYIVTVCNQ